MRGRQELWLLDTNVISELARARPDPAVRDWASEVRLPVSLSVIAVEEISYGLGWKPNPRIRAWFETFLAERCEVLAVTTEIARRAGDLRSDFRARGEQRTQADLLIAATCQAHQLVLVTRNTRDFEGCGVPLFDPFTD